MDHANAIQKSFSTTKYATEDVKQRLTRRLWEDRTRFDEVTWLQQQRHHDEVHSNGLNFGLEEFRSYAQGCLEFNPALTETGYSVAYRILVALGTYPFPPDPNTCINCDLLFQAAGMLREVGQRVLARPGYRLPHTDNDNPSRRKSRKRHSRDQLRLIFQALATGPSQTVVNDIDCITTTVLPTRNQDLLDALAIGMSLVDEPKLLYYAKHFTDAMAVLPSSESDRRLDWIVSWEDLEALLMLMRIATVQRGGTTLINEGPPGEQRFMVFISDEAPQKLMGKFQNHATSVDGGITWTGFYETM